MAEPLKDMRLGLPRFVDDMLDAESQGTGDDKQDIARAVLEAWARERHRVHKVYAKRLKSNGLQMELDGLAAGEDGPESGGRK